MKKHLITALILCWFVPTAIATPQLPSSNSSPSRLLEQVKKITASDATDNARFGFSVSISGDTLVVGARLEGNPLGSAYVFERNQAGANNWGEVTKLTASDGGEFGWSVSISGDTVVVGARLAINESGAAYVFERNQGGTDNWGEVKRLRASDAGGRSNAMFGISVSISEDTIVVGATRSDGAGIVSGSAYVFERDQGGTDNWGEVKKLIASDLPGDAANDVFGRSVTIDGDTIVVGAPNSRDANTGIDSGSAYVFERNRGGADKWGEVKKLNASDSAANDAFGGSVTISEDTVVVGAWGDDDAGGESGSAYVFERNRGGADNWGEVKKLTASDAAAGDEFGRSVTISEDTVVVGAHVNDDPGDQSGSVYVFERNQGGTDHWGEVKKLTASDAAALDQFGRSVTISEGTVVVGAHGNDDAGDESGSVYVFEQPAVATDLSITKTDSVDPVTAGSQLIYTITVRNFGPGDAQNVVVTDTLPSGVTLVSTSGCAEDPAAVPKCTLGTITNGDFDGYTITVTVDPVTTGTITNQAAVTSSTPEALPGDESVSEETTVTAQPSLTANFTSDLMTGDTPLTVQFINTSTAENTTITNFAWDFDNDGSVDSTGESPSFTYTSIGTFSVSLTVSDGILTATLIKESFITIEDSTPPVVTPPADIVAEATSAVGAGVNYPNATAIDNVGVVGGPDCLPTSGSLFSLGTTTVTCAASDAAGNVGQASFMITVRDTTPPETIIISAIDGNDLTVMNTGTTVSGAITFTFDGNDAVGVTSFECALDGAAFTACSSPASFADLGLGNHTFLVGAIDTSANLDATPAAFHWGVLTPEESIAEIIEVIGSFNLPNGVENSLLASLENAIKKLIDNNPNNDQAACNNLDAFIIKIAEKLANGDLTQTQADELIQAAEAVKDAAGC